MLRSDVEPQESDATANGYYNPDGVCYFMEDTDGQE
jgi:hypothetical protein